MKFDFVITNPPYSVKTEKGLRDLWSKFIPLALEILKEGGYLGAVHPSRWRKPEHHLWPLISNKQVEYLEIHSKQEGRKVFGATTRFDWYVLKNTITTKETKVIGEDGSIKNINLTTIPFLPNSLFDEILKLIAKKNEETCEIIYDFYSYEGRKEWMSEEQNEEFKYPCISSMYKDGSIKYLYSSRKDKGHFDIPKVIMTCAEKPYPLIDFKGKYGISKHAFGLRIESEEEGKNMKKAINSKKFQDIIKATKWGNYQIEWRMFKCFRKDFWKEFV